MTKNLSLNVILEAKSSWTNLQFSLILKKTVRSQAGTQKEPKNISNNRALKLIFKIIFKTWIYTPGKVFVTDEQC